MNIGIFIAGVFFGILAIAVFILINNRHRTFHEIEWHDAQKEKPSLYIVDKRYPHIRVLIATKKGVVIDSTYYPNIDHYDYEERVNVTHFAYIEELKQTIPPCPVCTGAFNDNPLYPSYANNSTL